MAPPSPHDRLFQAVFRCPRQTASWLASFLPAAVRQALDLTSLAPWPGQALGLRTRSHAADLAFTVRCRADGEDDGDPALLLVEHKSHADPDLGAQLLRYAVHLRRIAARRGAREPLVVAVALHHGDAPPAQRRPTRPLALRRLQPQLRYLVDDLHGVAEPALRRPGLLPLAQLALLALGTVRGMDSRGVLDALHRWRDVIAGVYADLSPPAAADALEAFACYLLDQTDVTQEELQMHITDPYAYTADGKLTTGYKLRQEGRAEGRVEGRVEGHAEGRVEGHAEGLAQALLRQLGRRFGPLPAVVDARVRAAAPAALEGWLDRVLDARTLDDVFAA
jgi:hypothetical protein